MIVFYAAKTTHNHDDLLFMALLLTGFFALMRLGELTYSDDKSLHDPRKVTKRSSVLISNDTFQFFLPSHKADRFFEGNTVIVHKNGTHVCPFSIFKMYLASRNIAFPFSSPLWLTKDGSIPTRAFFIRRLRLFFDSNIAGHSMRAGGATFMAENGYAPSLIQAAGRWASTAFQLYIRKNPVLIQALLFAREHENTSSARQPSTGDVSSPA